MTEPTPEPTLPTIESLEHAKRLASTLVTEADGEQFAQMALRNQVGKDFLRSPEWARVQRRLVDLTHRVRAERDGSDIWDGWVDQMVALPTVKMAVEFLCTVETSQLGRKFLDSKIWRRWAHARFPHLNPTTGEIGEMPKFPTVGTDVIYVSYGTPGGEFGRELRTARVTEAGAWIDVEVTGSGRAEPGALRRIVQVWDPLATFLFVMNPAGTFHAGPVQHHDTKGVLGRDPLDRQAPVGGTWHWPEKPAPAFTPAEDAEARRVADAVAAGICPDHGDQCASWVPALGAGGRAGSHVGPPRWRA